MNFNTKDIARAIQHATMEDRKIRPSDIPDIVASVTGTDINCYPGEPGHGCHEVAVFVSLRDRNNAGGRGHLKFPDALQILVQHLQGRCIGKTRVAVVISDSWDLEVYEEWQANIKAIRAAGVEVNFFALGKGNIMEPEK